MKTYVVGGAVRDELLGRANADRDHVVVGASPQAMLDKGFRPVGKDFPVFLHPETHEEYALARTERKTGHGYHGFTFGWTVGEMVRRGAAIAASHGHSHFNFGLMLCPVFKIMRAHQRPINARR